jgi:6-phosphogluconolactonase (cycloisomerase 2 family)
VLDGPGSGRVELYDVRPEDGALYDSGTGELEAREVFPAGLNPRAVAVDPTEGFLYVLSHGTAGVFAFAIASEDGTLSQIDLDLVGLDPAALALALSTE